MACEGCEERQKKIAAKMQEVREWLRSGCKGPAPFAGKNVDKSYGNLVSPKMPTSIHSKTEKGKDNG